MLYKKKGTPEVSDLVLCTVKRILYHSIFVTLNEYEGKEGMVHISEIAPGRIRNLRDYVTEGKTIVCKVLNVNRQTNNIDLSLRRVGTNQRVAKLNEYKQEEKAEKLLENVGKELKLTLPQMYEKIGNTIIEHYGSLYTFFQHIVTDPENTFRTFDVPEPFKQALTKIAKEKIKTPDIKVSGVLSLQTYASNGIADIKKILAGIERHGAHVHYLGAPKYKINVIAKDYKSAEHTLKEAVDESLKIAKKHNIEGAFVKSGS